LNRLLINACHNVTRRSGRQWRVEVPLLPTDSPSVPDTQTKSAVTDEIERGFRRLTIEQRSVLVLIYYLDLSLADAASTMGVPIGTLKSRLNRSLKALRASLEADARPPRYSAEHLA
jgi:RNA polymerase sigma-70 factor (ECF subfamily)